VQPGTGSRLWAAWDRACATDRTRIARTIVVVAAVLYLPLALYLMRGVGFTIDELTYFGEASGFSPGALAEPFGGHLQALSRFEFELTLRVFGAEHLPIQIVAVLTVIAAALLLFELVRRWVGPLAALPPALILLFLGSTPISLQGNAIMWGQATMLGLAAFLAFDRGSRRADVVACSMLLLSVLALEVGIAFSLGIAAWTFAREEVRSRLWVAVVPLLVYAAWWLWALKFDEGLTTASNVLVIPAFTVELLGAAAAAATGLGIDFSDVEIAVVDSSWAPVLVVTVVALVAAAVRRRGASPVLWAALVFLLAFAASTALAFGPLRLPTSARYLFSGAVGLLIVIAAAFRGSRPDPRALAALFVIAAFALPANIWMLQERGKRMRSLSAQTDATLAMIELQRTAVGPDFRVGIRVPIAADDYLAAVDRFGSPAPDAGELATEAPSVRMTADETLAAILAPRLRPLPRSTICVGASDGSTELTVPAGGAVLLSDQGGSVRLRRFAQDPAIPVGSLAPGSPAVLELPADDSDVPWLASIGGGAELSLCEAPAGG
jgi:hypothetical protein